MDRGMGCVSVLESGEPGFATTVSKNSIPPSSFFWLAWGWGKLLDTGTKHQGALLDWLGLLR